jgi:hypothetical protein
MGIKFSISNAWNRTIFITSAFEIPLPLVMEAISPSAFISHSHPPELRESQLRHHTIFRFGLFILQILHPITPAAAHFQRRHIHLAKRKPFLAKSFSDAPTWYTALPSMIIKRSWALVNCRTSMGGIVR